MKMRKRERDLQVLILVLARLNLIDGFYDAESNTPIPSVSHLLILLFSRPSG
jgi:hypothetical protein